MIQHKWITEKARIKIMRSQNQVRSKSQDHGIFIHGSNYFLIPDHKITLLFKFQITRSHNFPYLRSQDHFFSCISDHKITFFFRFSDHKIIFFSYLKSQFFFRISDHKINFFEISDYKIIFFSYLRSQDHIIFLSQFTKSIIFPSQITRTNKN